MHENKFRVIENAFEIYAESQINMKLNQVF